MMDGHIENLAKETDQLRARLETLYDMTKGKSRIYVDSEKLDQLFHQAEAIAREMVSLQSANEILYQNRGKASPKKAVSSKANGKFGGRPPREIAEKKRRIQYNDPQFLEGRQPKFLNYTPKYLTDSVIGAIL